MKIKPITAAVLFTAIVTLSGCSENKNSSITVSENSVTIEPEGFRFNVPEGWSVLTGDDVYQNIYSSYGDGYESADDMKQAMNAEGLNYIVYAASPDNDAMFTVSSQDMTVTGEGVERIPADEYARSAHDSMVFSYQASGYKIQEGSFSEIKIDDAPAYLSHFEILDGSNFILGQSETMIESGDLIHSFQICYANDSVKQDALSISITKGN